MVYPTKVQIDPVDGKIKTITENGVVKVMVQAIGIWLVGNRYSNKSVWRAINRDVIWNYDTGGNTKGIVVDVNHNAYVAGDCVGGKSVWKINKSGGLVWSAAASCCGMWAIALSSVEEAWGIDVDYVSNAVKDRVFNSPKYYKCKLSHTSTADDEPGVGVNWTTYWDEISEELNVYVLGGGEATVAWVIDTNYVVGDRVTNRGECYKCRLNHLSDSDNEPGGSGYWTPYWTIADVSVRKYNNAGALLWKYDLDIISYVDYGGIAVDSEGNVCVAYLGSVWKLNSNGKLIWKASIIGTGTGVCTDYNDDIIVCSCAGGSAHNVFKLCKTDGDIFWSGDYGAISGDIWGIKVDGYGDIYVARDTNPVKINGWNGAVIWTSDPAIYPYPSYAIALDKNEEAVFVVGGYNPGYETCMSKYRSSDGVWEDTWWNRTWPPALRGIAIRGKFGDFAGYSGTPCEGDTDPPTPSPSEWNTVPYCTSSGCGEGKIKMIATEASDPHADPRGMEYEFACVAGGGNDSGWQFSKTYEDVGLDWSTEYTYKVRTRDGCGNVGQWSTEESATTHSVPGPPTPSPMTWDTIPYEVWGGGGGADYYHCMVANTADPNAETAQYYFECTDAPEHSSDWQESTSYCEGGFEEGAHHCWRVRARYGDCGTPTDWSSTECVN